MPSQTILICEDDDSLRELMRVSLGGDYDFAEAANGREALQRARELHPDLILLDLMMPVEGGLAVLTQLRLDPEFADTPVVVVTAWSSEGDRRAAFAAGAGRFLPKPFDPEELANVVAELLAKPP